MNEANTNKHTETMAFDARKNKYVRISPADKNIRAIIVLILTKVRVRKTNKQAWIENEDKNEWKHKIMNKRELT